jgi:hypothetical protein
MIDHRGSGPTEVLIVGVAHLTDEVPDAAIAGGRDRLLAWSPDLIAVENLPGHLVVEYEERGGGPLDQVRSVRSCRVHASRQTAKISPAEAMRSHATPSGSMRANSRTAKAGPR